MQQSRSFRPEHILGLAFLSALVFFIFIRPDIAGEQFYRYHWQRAFAAMKSGDYETARTAYTNAAAVAKSSRMPNQKVIAAQFQLIRTLKAAKKWDEASDMEKQFDISRGFSPSVLFKRNYGMAQQYLEHGSTSNAERHISFCETEARGKSDENPLLVKCHLLRARILNAKNDTSGAVKELRLAIEMKKKLIPAGDPTAADDMNLAGALLVKLKRYDEAQSLFEESLALTTKLIGTNNERAIGTMKLLCENAKSSGNRAAEEKWTSAIKEAQSGAASVSEGDETGTGTVTDTTSSQSAEVNPDGSTVP